MSRSHVLLHCPDASLASSRAEAWEGRTQEECVSFWPTLGGGCGLLNFLELSGVGRVMDHEVDEDATRTERLDGWIVWETEERAEREGMG